MMSDVMLYVCVAGFAIWCVVEWWPLWKRKAEPCETLEHATITLSGGKQFDAFVRKMPVGFYSRLLGEPIDNVVVHEVPVEDIPVDTQPKTEPCEPLPKPLTPGMIRSVGEVRFTAPNTPSQDQRGFRRGCVDWQWYHLRGTEEIRRVEKQ